MFQAEVAAILECVAGIEGSGKDEQKLPSTLKLVKTGLSVLQVSPEVNLKLECKDIHNRIGMRNRVVFVWVAGKEGIRLQMGRKKAEVLV